MNKYKEKYVLDNHPVYKRIRKQINKGIDKYDHPVNPAEYSMHGWFNHLQEELTDGITYNEIMLLKLESVIKLLQDTRDIKDLDLIRNQIEEALTTLTEGKSSHKG